MDKRWLYVINISIVSTFVFLGSAIVSPVLPQYALIFNVPVALTGWVVSSFFMSKIVLDLPAGILSDMHANVRKKIMIIGLLILAVFSIVAGLAPTYLVLILARALSGAGAALYLTSAASWLAQFSYSVDRQKLMGFYYGFVVLGTAAGPGIGGLITAHYGIRAPFYFYALLVASATVATIPLPELVSENKKHPRSFRWSAVKMLFLNKSFILINLSTVVASIIVNGVINTLFPLYASVNLRFKSEQIGLLMTAGSIANAVLSLPSGWLSGRIGRKILVVTSFVSSSFLILFLWFQKDMNGLLFYICMQGLSDGLAAQIMPWFADLGRSDNVGTTMGLYRLAQDLGSFFGPILITYVSGYYDPNLITFPSLFISSVIAMVAGIITMKVDDPKIG